MKHKQSEVALFRERQTLEEESAHLGLTGLAQVAQHEVISARGAKLIDHLVEQGQHVQARALMDRPDWEEPTDA